DVYLNRQDPAVTVGMRLRAPGSDLDGALALVWTTTPWTLPSNLAMAVNPEVEYSLVESAGERYVLASARLGDYARELGEAAAGTEGGGHTVLRTFTGADLVDVAYQPVFDFFQG